MFKEKHGVYTATDHYTERCAQGGLSVNVPTDYTGVMRVLKAKYIDGVWRAIVVSIQEKWVSDRVQTSATSGFVRSTLTCGGKTTKSKGTSVLQSGFGGGATGETASNL